MLIASIICVHLRLFAAHRLCLHLNCCVQKWQGRRELCRANNPHSAATLFRSLTESGNQRMGTISRYQAPLLPLEWNAGWNGRKEPRTLGCGVVFIRGIASPSMGFSIIFQPREILSLAEICHEHGKLPRLLTKRWIVIRAFHARVNQCDEFIY